MVDVFVEHEAVSKGTITKVVCSNEVGPPIFVNKDAVGLDLVVTAGTATVEQCSGLPSEIQAGTATWFLWGHGHSAINASSAVWGATAIRLNAASGTASLYVRN